MTQETRKKLPPGISQTTMYLLTAKAIGYDLVEWNVAVYADKDLAKNHQKKATRWKNDSRNVYGFTMSFDGTHIKRAHTLTSTALRSQIHHTILAYIAP